MEQDLKNISSLLDNISKIATTTSESTLFDMMGNGSRERIHSAIIGFLLNPKAHDGGEKCLKEFIKIIPQNALGDFNPDFSTKVELEKDLGPVQITCDRPIGGDVDIFIEDKNGHSLVIENKIHATDGDCQLLRYHNSLSDLRQPHTLIYLTLFEKKPSDKSLGLLSDNKDVVPLKSELVTTISYSDINKWLSRIKEYCSSAIVQNIEQYQSLINKLIMKEKLTYEILSSGSNYEAAIRISEVIDDCRMDLKRRFISDLGDELSKLLDEYIIENYSASENNQIIGLSLTPKSNSESNKPYFEVLIDWRLYISCSKGGLSEGDWEYIGDYDAYNFHDCSPLVAEYLSSMVNKHLVVFCATHQIIDIINRIESIKPEIG